MKVKNKKTILTVVLILFLVIGVTIAYFTSSASFENVFNTGTYKVVTTEVFESPDNWKPGQSTTANMMVSNEGTVDVAVRAKITESFVDKSGNTISGLATELSNGNPVVLKQQDSGWVKVGDYYYYTEKLTTTNKDTSNLISVVTFNKEAGDTKNCTTDNNGNITCQQCTTNADGTTTCTNTSGYASTSANDTVNYKITVEFEMLQYSAHKTEWSSDLQGKEVTELNSIYEVVNDEDYNSSNNNVLFGGYCWNIIRTTSTGGTKLLYNGQAENGACNGTNNSISTSVFDSSVNTYMKNNEVTTHKTVASTIKGVVDNWY